MQLVKTLIAFLAFSGVIVLSLLVSVAGWLTKQLLRSKLKFAIAFLASGAVVIALIVALVSAKASQQLPPQPLAFPHTTHAGQLAINCLFCHRTAQVEPVAGIPSVEQCMFCHQVAGKEKPEIAKLVTAYEKGDPLNWLRINRLPDTVHFDHSAHTNIRVNIACSTCHGPVEEMERIVKVRTLEMGDCLDCHRSSNAPTSCSTCHY